MHPATYYIDFYSLSLNSLIQWLTLHNKYMVHLSVSQIFLVSVSKPAVNL